jgi:hypothetical protein
MHDLQLGLARMQHDTTPSNMTMLLLSPRPPGANILRGSRGTLLLVARQPCFDLPPNETRRLLR